MKSLFVFFLSILNLSVCAQDNIKPKDSSVVTEPVAVPQIVIKVPFGKRVTFGDVEVKLTRVIDSRCPQNTNCVWAGEVVVEASIFKNGKQIETRKLNLNSPAKTLFNSSDQELMGYSVLPYPDVTKPKTKQEDYVLNVVWKKHTGQ